ITGELNLNELRQAYQQETIDNTRTNEQQAQIVQPAYGTPGSSKGELSHQVTKINGQAASENYQGEISITLSQKFLLDKLAHAYQNTIRVNNGEEVKSQCASSEDKENYPELVAEHTQLTKEIKQMIESSSEYQELKT
ncbi:6251_t:CDS:2, partial [Racocetra persica]